MYLNRLTRFPLIALLVITGILGQSCAAATMPVNYTPPLDMSVFSIQASTVAYGIGQCLKGAAGTQILVKDMQILFVWGYEYSAVGLFGIDLANKTAFDVLKLIRDGGNFVNAKTAGDLLTWMKENGWTVTTGAAIGEAAKVTLLAALERLVSAPFLALYMVLPVDAEGNYDPLTLPGLAPSVDS